MSPDSSADARDSEAFSPTHGAVINPTPIARGKEAAHLYATPLLSPNIRFEQGVPRIVDNIQAASYRGERSSDSLFSLFPNLPLEIRLDIWRHAILVPRIVEVDFVTNWFYRSETLPPLLYCNRESRIECLKAYNDVIPKWIRFDWDNYTSSSWISVIVLSSPSTHTSAYSGGTLKRRRRRSSPD